MKKILTALLCALGFSLVSQAEKISGTNFEGLSVGFDEVIGKTDDGLTEGGYWSNTVNGVEALVATNTFTMVEVPPQEEGGDPTYDKVFDIVPYSGTVGYPTVHDEAQTSEKFLSINTKGGELVRNIQEGGSAQSIGDGIYFDSMVQFTATDALDANANAGSESDKLILWLRDNRDGTTNLVVTAGYLNNQYKVETNNYVVLNAVQADKWYRLTIQAVTGAIGVKNDNQKKYVGYAVYIDGIKATYSTDVAAFDDDRTGYEVSSPYNNYLYNDSVHALYPSLKGWDATGADTFTAVAFSGVGAVDDIEFTRKAPDFANPPASLTVEWTVGVDTVTITPGEGEAIVIAANGVNGSTNITDKGTYTIAATVQTGYVAATVSQSEVTVENTEVKVKVETEEGYAEINGKLYASLADAITAAQNGDTVKLYKGKDLGAATLAIDNENAFVLDLNGQVLSGSNGDGVLSVGNALTIIDSIGGGAVSNTTAEAEAVAVLVDGGSLVIGCDDNDINDMGASFVGKVGDANDNPDTISIVRGKFSSAPAAGYIAEGSYQKEELEDGLYVVEPGTPVNNVAEVNGQGYETLAAAIAAAQANDTITLLADIDLTSTVTIDKNLTIDLNGNDVTATDCRAFHVKAGAFALTGSGKVSATASAEVRAMAKPSFGSSSSVIRVGSDTATTSFTLGEGVTVSSDWCYGVSYFGTKKQTVVIDGTVTVTGVQAALSGNGSEQYNKADGGSDVTVNGTVSATQDYAIYNPQTGTTVINGSVTGPGGIEVKAGSVTVNSGAVITATAQEQTHTASNDGTSTAGYAIAAVGSKSYQGEPAITVTGGTINGVAVVLADSADVENGTITATSNEISKPEGYKWVDATETPGSYTLKEIEYATVTIASVANCTITVKNGNDNVVTGARFDVDDAVELTVTRVAAEGYKLAAGCLAEETVTMSENRTITAVVEEDKTDDWAVDTKDVEGKNASEAYGITGALAEVDAAKLTVWAKANNVEFADASTKINPEAYALNCANTDEAIATAKEAFDIQAITVDSEGNVTVTAPEALTGEFNGTLQLKGSNNLKDWSDTDTTSGYQFFYYELNLK